MNDFTREKYLSVFPSGDGYNMNEFPSAPKEYWLQRAIKTIFWNRDSSPDCLLEYVENSSDETKILFSAWFPELGNGLDFLDANIKNLASILNYCSNLRDPAESVQVGKFEFDFVSECGDWNPCENIEISFDVLKKDGTSKRKYGKLGLKAPYLGIVFYKRVVGNEYHPDEIGTFRLCDVMQEYPQGFSTWLSLYNRAWKWNIDKKIYVQKGKDW